MDRSVLAGERVLYAGTFQGFLDVNYRSVNQALHRKLGSDEYLARVQEAGARQPDVLREVADRLGLEKALRETYRDAHLEAIS